MTQCYIVCAGDLGREVLSTIIEINRQKEDIKVVGFIDDYKCGQMVEGLPVYQFDYLKEIDPNDFEFVIAIGNPQAIRDIKERLMLYGVNNWLTVVHPRSFVSSGVKIGKGCYIAPNASLAIGTQIDNWCVVNQNVSIGHDVELGSFCVISPGCILSGRTICKEAVFFGSGAITVPKISIGYESIVAANTVVNKNLSDYTKIMPVIRNMEVPCEQ